MLSHTVSCMAALLFASLAAGQPSAGPGTEFVFRFVHARTSQEFQEIATAVRAVGDLRDLTVNDASRTLTLRGTQAEGALAGWLFGNLDRPAPGPPGVAEFRVPGGGDDIVRVFYLRHAAAAADIQEVATAVRSIGDIRRLFICASPRAIALRGTAAEVSLSEWVIGQLDAEPGLRPSLSGREYRDAGGSDDVTRVFFLNTPATARDLQEVATLVRAIGDIRRLFVCNASRSLSMRGTAAQAALAGWLLERLDSSRADSFSNAYQLPGDEENQVRLFYFSEAVTPARLQEIAVNVRSTSRVRRLFTCSSRRALALRGTAAQVEQAGGLIRQARSQ